LPSRWISREEYDRYNIPGLNPQGRAIIDRLDRLEERLRRIEALLQRREPPAQS
jgi:hypothetical protein